MKCCDMNAGKLRSLITIERVTRSSDGMGGWSESWAEDPTGGVFAYFTGLTGTERWEAMRVVSGNLFRAIIRYRDDGNGAPYYNEGDRVKKAGRIYDIISVMDMEDERMWLQIDLMETKAE